MSKLVAFKEGGVSKRGLNKRKSLIRIRLDWGGFRSRARNVEYDTHHKL